MASEAVLFADGAGERADVGEESGDEIMEALVQHLGQLGRRHPPLQFRRLALRRAAASGSPKFFLGTDSAPHAVGDKESACGCAGIFNAPVALETYAEVFEEEGALDKLEAFASEHGPRFYGVPLNIGVVVLERTPRRVPLAFGTARTRLVPFQAGLELPWKYGGRIDERESKQRG